MAKIDRKFIEEMNAKGKVVDFRGRVYDEGSKVKAEAVQARMDRKAAGYQARQSRKSMRYAKAYCQNVPVEKTLSMTDAHALAGAEFGSMLREAGL